MGCEARLHSQAGCARRLGGLRANWLSLKGRAPAAGWGARLLWLGLKRGRLGDGSDSVRRLMLLERQTVGAALARTRSVRTADATSTRHFPRSTAAGIPEA